MKITANLLGSPSISLNGKRLSFSLKKVEGLMYFLLTTGEISREKLASLLWGDRNDEIAFNNLRNALYLLKKEVDEKFLLVDRRTVQINPQIDVQLDLHLLENTNSIDYSELEKLGQEFLSGFSIAECNEFDEWLQKSRQLYKEQLIKGLKKRISMNRDARDLEEIIRSLQLLINFDPFDEEAHRNLMEIYYEKGLPAKAVQVYTMLEHNLEEELGIGPDKVSVDLYNKLINQRKKISLTPVPSQENQSFFYGRQRELETLLNNFLNINNVPQCINIYGESGVGKSYLVRYFLNTYANKPDHKIFWGQAHEMGEKHALSPWNSLLGNLAARYDLGEAELDPVKTSFLSAFFPSFAAGKRITPTLELSSFFHDPNPVVLGQILAELFQWIGKNEKVILVLEDLQWFDILSLEMLQSFLASQPDSLLVIITSRTGIGKNKRAYLEKLKYDGHINLCNIFLKPFTSEETKEFCNRLLKDQNISLQQHEQIYTETEGLPFFLVELLNPLLEGGSMDTFINRVSGILVSRYSGLSLEERNLLEYICIFLGNAPYDDLLNLTKYDSIHMADIVESLCQKGWLRELVSDPHKLVFSFNHVKVKEFVYKQISETKKRAFHKQLVQILEDQKNPAMWDHDLSNRMVFHYQKAGLAMQELKFYFKEMRMHIMLNHELFPLLPDEALHSCSTPFSERQQTEDKFDEIRELLHNLHRQQHLSPDLPKMEASYLELRGGYLIAWGSYNEGRPYIQRALKIARKEGLHDLVLRCLQHHCLHGIQTDNISIIETFAKEMYKTARQTDKEPYMGLALRFLGVASQLRGNFENAEKILRGSINLFEGLRDYGNSYTLSILAAWNYLGELRHWSGNFQEALECFDYCIDICNERKIFWGLCLFHANAGHVALDCGDHVLMEKHVYTAVDLFERCQGGRSGSIAYSLKALADTRNERFEEAIHALKTADRLCKPIRKKSWMAVQSWVKGLMREMMEHNPSILNMWKDTLTLSAQEYTQESLYLFQELGLKHKVQGLENFLSGQKGYPCMDLNYIQDI